MSLFARSRAGDKMKCGFDVTMLRKWRMVLGAMAARPSYARLIIGVCLWMQPSDARSAYLAELNISGSMPSQLFCVQQT
ncbi:uncharacterized protein BO95DRAFT_461429 [Aspergillus brunneoviolaceus CBS 621.78]|uniref:Uncharacterized protein n=1 Tax=Aspergillus brunneoviolaceus CBS 621.78 TaxID=1450534 RepID=A0ACD1GG05_9EURO|nr:hypothetical protein BO95DRAFT_461429 [Aspergillus brunneoviolaceus CBS 621.78]RAH48016.1 hypothetical protein BO95DRAFT_461429 [Aspergillus brunneoviolaceus CBS 621.78]